VHKLILTETITHVVEAELNPNKDLEDQAYDYFVNIYEDWDDARKYDFKIEVEPIT